VRSRLVEAGQ